RGDGRADIVGFGGAGAYTSISNGDGTFQAWQLGVAAFGTTAGGWTNNNIYPRFVEDITGDGSADIVGFASTGVYTSISNGDGTFQAPTLLVAEFGTTAGGWTNNNIYPRFVEDITGDSRADIIGFASNGVYDWVM
ncbi:VCBS repeat-containing protein, partial [Nitrosospira sp. Nsp2]|uniref:FG-GAP repeat domain-containing protein n=1 Tax=Nitrosospira sp. Nsp2 TaxID=136548 RepID=UPI0015E75EBB